MVTFDEHETMEVEAPWSISSHYSGIRLVALRKTTNRLKMSTILADIRIGYVPLFLRNVGHHQDNTASQPWRPESTRPPPWEPQFSEKIYKFVEIETAVRLATLETRLEVTPHYVTVTVVESERDGGRGSTNPAVRLIKGHRDVYFALWKHFLSSRG
jgi:hypothetical protein